MSRQRRRRTLSGVGARGAGRSGMRGESWMRLGRERGIPQSQAPGSEMLHTLWLSALIPEHDRLETQRLLPASEGPDLRLPALSTPWERTPSLPEPEGSYALRAGVSRSQGPEWGLRLGQTRPLSCSYTGIQLYVSPVRLLSQVLGVLFALRRGPQPLPHTPCGLGEVTCPP